MTADDKLLVARVLDKARQCDENSMITNSVFLDMHERSVVTGIKMPSPDIKMLFYGGFDDSERTAAVFMPGYTGVGNADDLRRYFDEYADDDPVAVVEIEKDKFSPALGHRDYLGALMALGIRREMTGDIIVTESGCKIAVLTKIAPFIAENLSKAGRGTLKARITAPANAREGTRATGTPDSFTVSSMRLDSVVKNAFHLSRGDAAEAIEGGAVFVNDCECTKPDKKISGGDKIVFRRKGRIIIKNCSDISKRGRTIVEILRF